MLINWNAREFEVFLVVAQTLSFRRAAEQVHLSQPAVSGLIARLEATLEVRLFDRTTRNVQLTAAGEVLRDQVLLLRHQSNEAVQAVRNISKLHTGSVTLAALPSLAATAGPGLAGLVMMAGSGWMAAMVILAVSGISALGSCSSSQAIALRHLSLRRNELCPLGLALSSAYINCTRS